MIVLGSDGQSDREHFASVESAGVVGTEYSRRDGHFTIWLCRGLKWKVQYIWPQTEGVRLNVVPL